MRGFVRKVHRWLGLATGAVVFVVAITGALYAFEAELREWIHHDRYFVDVPADRERVPLQSLLTKADALLGDEAPVIQLRVYADPERSVVFTYERHAPERFGYAASEPVNKRVYFDPYTGEALEVANTKWEVLEVAARMHTSLLLGYELGHQITRWAVVIFLAMMASGLLLWWPRNRRAARHRVWFRWGPSAGWKRKNYDLHSILGVYVLAIASVMALTGLVWSFSWVNDTLQWLVNGGRHIPGQGARSVPAEAEATDPLDRIYAFVAREHPDARFYVIHLSTARSPEGVYYGTAFLSDHGMWKNSAYAFDRYSLEPVKRNRHEDKTNGARLYDLNYDVHTGTILGLPGKLLAFSASLIVASLPVTGALLWWGRRKQPPPSPQRA